jgi:hypothetical protein
MADVSSIVRQLKVERDRVAKQLSGMDAALTAFAGVYRMGSRAVNGGRCQQRVGPRSQQRSDGVGLSSGSQRLSVC